MGSIVSSSCTYRGATVYWVVCLLCVCLYASFRALSRVAGVDSNTLHESLGAGGGGSPPLAYSQGAPVSWLPACV